MYTKFILSLPPYWRSTVLLVASTMLITAMHAGIRQVTSELQPGMHPFEVAFFRNLFGLVFILPLIIRRRANVFTTARPFLQALRGVLNTISMLMFFYGISVSPLATVSALSFTSPLFAALAAFVVLREKVTFARIAALVIGFGGMLVVVQPTTVGFDLGTLALLFSSLLWALVLIDIKILARTDSSFTIVVYQLAYLAPLTLIAALFHWQWPNLEQIIWLTAIGVLATSGQMLLTEAYRYSDASSLVPLDFFKLIWGALLGYLMFGQIPGLPIWVGGLMIFIGASWVAWEQSARQRQDKAAAADKASE